MFTRRKDIGGRLLAPQGAIKVNLSWLHPCHCPYNVEKNKMNTNVKEKICVFCGNPIIKMEGRDSDSLAVHSLDGNHNNWNSENKVFSHYGCHNRFHLTGDKNPMKRPESRKKIKDATQRHWDNMTPEERTERGRKLKQWWVNCTPEERDEHSRKTSLATTGEKNPNFGKHPSEETNQKNRESQIKRWKNASPEERKEHGRKTQEGMKKVR